MKQGYKTTEFWLSLIAVLTGAFMGSGVIENNLVLQGLGLLSSALGAIGYTSSRGITKASEAKSSALKHMAILETSSLLPKE